MSDSRSYSNQQDTDVFFNAKKSEDKSDDKMEASEFNPFGYRTLLNRLYSERASICAKKTLSDNTSYGERERRLLFQLITEHQYTKYSPDILPDILKDKNIVLMCIKAGGSGDVAQTFLCAELISKQFPGYPIKLYISCPRYDSEDVTRIFPVDKFETHFLSNDYREKEKQLMNIVEQAACLFGIAVPEASPVLKGPLYRTIREYGFGNRNDVFNDIKGYNLSLGFRYLEEGVNFPAIQQHTLSDLKTPWLKKALNIQDQKNEDAYIQDHKLYHMYMPVWTMQMTALYAIAAIESKVESKTLDVFMPLEYSLQQYIEWGALSKDHLIKNGVGKLIRITPSGEESLDIGEGKVMRIFSGPIVKADMETVQQYSEPFFGCTGDVSLSEAFVWGKIPYYASTGMLEKTGLINFLIALAESRNFDNLAAFFKIILNQDEVEAKIYEKNTPRRISFYQSDPSMDLSETYSVPRTSIPELAPKLPEYGYQLATLYLNSSLIQEARQLDQFIVDNFNFAPRLIAMTYRGLFIKNYPELIDIEEGLWNKFNAGQLKEEDLVAHMQEAISACMNKNKLEFKSSI